MMSIRYPNYKNQTEAMQAFRDCARIFHLSDTWQVSIQEDSVVGFFWTATNGVFHLREVLPRDEPRHEDTRYIAYLGGASFRCKDAFTSHGATPFDALLGARIAVDLINEQVSHFNRLLSV